MVEPELEASGLADASGAALMEESEDAEGTGLPSDTGAAAGVVTLAPSELPEAAGAAAGVVAPGAEASELPAAAGVVAPGAEASGLPAGAAGEP